VDCLTIFDAMLLSAVRAISLCLGIAGSLPCQADMHAQIHGCIYLPPCSRVPTRSGCHIQHVEPVAYGHKLSDLSLLLNSGICENVQISRKCFGLLLVL
jgi:hypothetical protein